MSAKPSQRPEEEEEDVASSGSESESESEEDEDTVSIFEFKRLIFFCFMYFLLYRGLRKIKIVFYI
jgi:hypothetical protein